MSQLSKFAIGDRVIIQERPMEGRAGTVRSIEHYRLAPPKPGQLSGFACTLSLDEPIAAYTALNGTEYMYQVVEEGLVREASVITSAGVTRLTTRAQIDEHLGKGSVMAAMCHAAMDGPARTAAHQAEVEAYQAELRQREAAHERDERKRLNEGFQATLGKTVAGIGLINDSLVVTFTDGSTLVAEGCTGETDDAHAVDVTFREPTT